MPPTGTCWLALSSCGASCECRACVCILQAVLSLVEIRDSGSLVENRMECTYFCIMNIKAIDGC